MEGAVVEFDNASICKNGPGAKTCLECDARFGLRSCNVCDADPDGRSKGNCSDCTIFPNDSGICTACEDARCASYCMFRTVPMSCEFL